MTLAEFRRRKKTATEEPLEGAAAATAAVAQPPGGSGAAGEAAHPGPGEYVRVAMALVVVEVLELVVYYLDVLGRAALPLLLALTVIQFALVAMWYMHLRFDSRFFSTLLLSGIVLAVAVFLVVLAAFRVFFV